MSQLKKKLRIPRPMGLTMMAREYALCPDPEQKTKKRTKITKYVIQLWISNGMHICNKKYSIEELASALDIHPTMVMRQMNEEIGRMGEMIETKEKGKVARALIFQAINWALDGYHKAANQASILIGNQGTKYVPFLTSDVNRAIGNLPNAQKGLLEVIKLMQDGESRGMAGLPEGQQNGANQAYITVDSAVNIIKNNGQLSLLEAPENINNLVSDIPFESLPNINARDQDLTSTGLIMAPKLPNDGAEFRHDGRREEALGGTIITPE